MKDVISILCVCFAWAEFSCANILHKNVILEFNQELFRDKLITVPPNHSAVKRLLYDPISCNLRILKFVLCVQWIFLFLWKPESFSFRICLYLVYFVSSLICLDNVFRSTMHAKTMMSVYVIVDVAFTQQVVKDMLKVSFVMWFILVCNVIRCVYLYTTSIII